VDCRRQFGQAVLFGCLVVAAAAGEEPVRPKYAATTVRLARDHEYVRRCPAPDFWSLIPYYASQPDDHSCSAAAAAMTVNALRSDWELRTDEPLATPDSVVAAVEPARWRDKLAAEGPGVTLDELAELLRAALAGHAVVDAKVEVRRFDDRSPRSRQELESLLAQNERTSRDVIVVNFLQGAVTGDPEGNVGHFAPLGAYDAARGRVLVLDSDRRWYEPYWVSVTKVLEGMTTIDVETGQSRGLIRVSVGDQARGAGAKPH
jgi:hypothetical protein